MKVLLLVMDEQRVILDRLYDTIRVNCADCDVRKITKAQQQNLGRYLASVDYQRFDRVVIFTRLKRLVGQLRVLKCIPGLVFLEHDAFQNYMGFGKYRGQYSRLYQRLPWARLLVSGFNVSRQLQAEGLDAVFVSKGYDEQSLRNLHLERDLEVGFLGSLKSIAYSERKQVLEEIAQRMPITVTRTASGQAYLEGLNRIRIFISADVGMGEYMIKNFEAMACGCVLVAWNQGAEEVAAIGFQDMHNVLLYNSVDEALEKIQLLLGDPDMAKRIAQAGEQFANDRYTFARVGKDLAHAIEAPMRPWPKVGAFTRLWVRLRYNLRVAA